jgi:hypothetical protein
VSDDFDVIELRVISPIGSGFSPTYEGDEDLDFPVVAVTINGIDLRARVAEALRRQRPWVEFWSGAESLAGDRGELCLGVHAVAPPSQHWFGAPNDPDLVVNDHVAVLTCSCGAFGCGGTAARIAMTEHTVTWSDFVDPWGTSEPVGSFRFERVRYEREIKAL